MQRALLYTVKKKKREREIQRVKDRVLIQYCCNFFSQSPCLIVFIAYYLLLLLIL